MLTCNNALLSIWWNNWYPKIVLIAQDAFRDHGVIGQKFSTYDKDHGNCAKECGSGWWYGSCTLVNLNAPFFEVHRDPVWNGYISGGTNCVMTEMLIKRN